MYAGGVGCASQALETSGDKAKGCAALPERMVLKDD